MSNGPLRTSPNPGLDLRRDVFGVDEVVVRRLTGERKPYTCQEENHCVAD